MTTGSDDKKQPIEVARNAVNVSGAQVASGQQPSRTVSLSDRLKQLQRRAAALGKDDPDFDQKAFRDEMWGHGKDF